MRNPSEKGAFCSSNHVADSLILADIHGKTDGASCGGKKKNPHPLIHDLLDKTQLFQMTGSELASSGQGRDITFLMINKIKLKKKKTIFASTRMANDS